MKTAGVDLDIGEIVVLRDDDKYYPARLEDNHLIIAGTVQANCAAGDEPALGDQSLSLTSDAIRNLYESRK